MSPVSGHARTPLSAAGQQTESWASSRIALQSIPKVVDNLVAQGPSQIVTTSPAPTTKSGPDVEVTLPDPPAPLDCCNADKWGNSAQSRQINSVRFPAIANQSSPEQLQVPDSILEAETLLNQKFDLAMHWGPSCSLTRAERLERGRRLGLASQKWNWVSTVLDKYPELAKLKSDQRIQVLQQQHVPMLAADQTVVLVSAQTDPAVKACLSTHSLTASKSKGAKNSALLEESKQVPDPSERSQLEGRSLGGHSSMAKKRRIMSSVQSKHIPPNKHKSQHMQVQNTRIDRWCQPQPPKHVSEQSSNQEEIKSNGPSEASLDPRLLTATASNVLAAPVVLPASAHASGDSSRLYRVSLIPSTVRVSGLTPWIPGTLGLYPKFIRSYRFGTHASMVCSDNKLCSPVLIVSPQRLFTLQPTSGAIAKSLGSWVKSLVPLVMQQVLCIEL